MAQPPKSIDITDPEGTPVEFETMKDIAGYIKLDDGNVIHIRVHIDRVVKTNRTVSNGIQTLPAYAITHSLYVTAMSEADSKRMNHSKRGFIEP